MFANPFAEHQPSDAGVDSEAAEKRQCSFTKLSSRISGKVLTKQNANVFLEIFPLAGSGSLKFTLCD
jgi:hypothetical protein